MNKQFSHAEAHKSHMYTHSVYGQLLVRLLQRRHGASLAASSCPVSQNQSSVTTAANVSLPPAPAGTYWEYLATMEKLIYHWQEVKIFTFVSTFERTYSATHQS